TLTQGQLELSDQTGTETITGPGANLLSVSGNHASRVFRVDAGVTASISGLTITGGNAGHFGKGGGVSNYGTTTLTACTISGTSAPSGGGLKNAGGATLTACTISGNSGGFYGGGWFGDGIATLTNCTVSGNFCGARGAGLFLKGGRISL